MKGGTTMEDVFVEQEEVKLVEQITFISIEIHE